MPILSDKSIILYLLLAFIPISIILNQFSENKLLIFITAGLAIIPLAKLIGDATEHLGSYYGATLGSLLNVTFGNATEIVISISAINAGLFLFVKASIIGSILSNIILIFGLSILAGGLKNKEQVFNKENISIQTSMLFLAITVLAIPTILTITITGSPEININSTEGNSKIQFISDLFAMVLLAVYLASLLFTFLTHRYLFVTSIDRNKNINSIKDQSITKNQSKSKVSANSLVNNNYEKEYNNLEKVWTKKKSFIILTASILGVAIISEILVGSVEEVAHNFGIGEIFIGAVIIGLVGNAAEHASAIMLATKNKLDISIGIATGSGTQIALFVTPVLVIIGFLIGRSFNLVFTVFEVVSLFLAVIILRWISQDGKSNWFEGIMLTAVFIVFAIGFYFID